MLYILSVFKTYFPSLNYWEGLGRLYCVEVMYRVSLKYNIRNIWKTKTCKTISPSNFWLIKRLILLTFHLYNDKRETQCYCHLIKELNTYTNEIFMQVFLFQLNVYTFLTDSVYAVFQVLWSWFAFVLWILSVYVYICVMLLLYVDPRKVGCRS